MSKNKALVPAHSAISQREDEATPSLFIKGIAMSLASSAVMGLLLITLMTAIAYANPDPSSLVPSLSLISLMLSSFAGGFVSSKTVRSSHFLCGALCGFAMCGVYWLISLLFHSSSPSDLVPWQAISLRIAIIAFAVLGSLAGGCKKSQKRKKHRFG